jgi:glycosyltransferase involved in cell wall biosynthesis
LLTRPSDKYPNTPAEERLSLIEKPPKVSVVLPTHNGSKYLAQSIRSVMDQTLSDWELIVVDDCSSDSTAAIVRGFEDTRIHYVRNGVNCKLPRSLNRGFALASGEYLTWTSDDNWFAPNALERMATALDLHPLSDLVYAPYWLVDEAGNVISHRGLEPAIILPQGYSIGACFMYRRRALRDVGRYDPSVFLVEDYDFWLRFHNRGLKMSMIAEDLYFYRLHSDSLSSHISRPEIAKMSDELRKKRYSPRRHFGLRLYRLALKSAGPLRESRLWPLLLPIRFIVGAILRRYQRYFYV